jgi:hypothetical protein
VTRRDEAAEPSNDAPLPNPDDYGADYLDKEQ